MMREFAVGCELGEKDATKPCARIPSKSDRQMPWRLHAEGVLALGMAQTPQRRREQLRPRLREHDGNSVPAVFRTEGTALSFIKARIKPGTVVHADEAGAWNASTALRNKAHQSSDCLQPRWRLHELGGGILLPAAPCRDRPSSPYCRCPPAPIRSGGIVARRQPQQRRTGEPRGRLGVDFEQIQRFL
jgi:hypothetical protein